MNENGYTGTGNYEHAGVVHPAEYYFPPEMTDEQVEYLISTMQHTNRAARRARARAERKRA